MATTAQEVYTAFVRTLPPTERLRLAALILESLTQNPEVALLDDSDEWTGEDEHDLAVFALTHAATLYPEEEDLG